MSVHQIFSKYNNNNNNNHHNKIHNNNNNNNYNNHNFSKNQFNNNKYLHHLLQAKKICSKVFNLRICTLIYKMASLQPKLLIPLK